MSWLKTWEVAQLWLEVLMFSLREGTAAPPELLCYLPRLLTRCTVKLTFPLIRHLSSTEWMPADLPTAGALLAYRDIVSLLPPVHSPLVLMQVSAWLCCDQGTKNLVPCIKHGWGRYFWWKYFLSVEDARKDRGPVVLGSCGSQVCKAWSSEKSTCRAVPTATFRSHSQDRFPWSDSIKPSLCSKPVFFPSYPLVSFHSVFPQKNWVQN